jgi:hypothetical protein
MRLRGLGFGGGLGGEDLGRLWGELGDLLADVV